MTPKGTGLALQSELLIRFFFLFSFFLVYLEHLRSPRPKDNLQNVTVIHQGTKQVNGRSLYGRRVGGVSLSLPLSPCMLSSSAKGGWFSLWLCRFSLEVEPVGERCERHCPALRRFSWLPIRITDSVDKTFNRGGHAELTER